MSRLPRLAPSKISANGRIGSPAKASTLMISAPRSESSRWPYGAAKNVANSTTRTPSRGVAIGAFPDTTGSPAADQPADRTDSPSASSCGAGAAMRPGVSDINAHGPTSSMRPSAGSSISATIPA